MMGGIAIPHNYALAGHSDIAPLRKTDPGPHFEWSRLRRETSLDARYFPYLKFSDSR